DDFVNCGRAQGKPGAVEPGAVALDFDVTDCLVPAEHGAFNQWLGGPGFPAESDAGFQREFREASEVTGFRVAARQSHDFLPRRDASPWRPEAGGLEERAGVRPVCAGLRASTFGFSEASTAGNVDLDAVVALARAIVPVSDVFGGDIPEAHFRRSKR